MLAPYYQKGTIEAGLDEAGRGCLAGPVFAAAVILPLDACIPQLNDSKQMTEANRYAARPLIEAQAIAWAVAQVDPAEIDEINILQASFLAMHRALDQLSIRPELLLIDGNRFVPYGEIPFECIIKGDGKLQAIAAASVLAKTYRDDYMQQLHTAYPHYAWASNKGYPAPAHRRAIAQHGACKHHRHTFQLLPRAEQGKLF